MIYTSKMTFGSISINAREGNIINSPKSCQRFSYLSKCKVSNSLRLLLKLVNLKPQVFSIKIIFMAEKKASFIFQLIKIII